jgi:hypothetical protein
MTSSHDSDHTVLKATPARQGRWGRPVFWVLVFGTLLAAIGLFAAWTWRAPDLAATTPTLSEQRAAAAGTDTPQQAPKSATP